MWSFSEPLELGAFQYQSSGSLRTRNRLGVVFQGEIINDKLGLSTIGIGNFDGLPGDDIAVSAESNSNGYAGLVYVISGKNKAKWPTLANNEPYNVNLISAGGFQGLKITGAAANDFLGWSMASAGDLNGDGFSDLMLGARNKDTIWVVFGGFNITGKSPLVQSIKSFEDGIKGFKIVGEVYSAAGWAMGNIGDINNDGYDELLVGAHAISTAYVIWGHASGGASSWPNLNLSSSAWVEGQIGFSIKSSLLGYYLLAGKKGGGDVNGDKIADFILANS